MIEIIFLLVLAFIWLIFATIYDFKTTEIPNWLNFSLITFALGFRFFYSLFSNNFNFFYEGVIGLGIFFILANLLYYGKMFAGGDAKFMIALGVILPFSYNLLNNLQIFISFLFLFLICGAVYGILASLYFVSQNFKSFKKDFAIRYRKYFMFLLFIMIFGIFAMIVGLMYNPILLYLGIFSFVLPLLYIYTKSVDESCMVKQVNPKFLREGDWLYRDINIGKQTIKANWDGLTEDSIKLLIKRNKQVKIKQGIAFGIVFLLSFLALVYFYFINTNLWNSLW